MILKRSIRPLQPPLAGASARAPKGSHALACSPRASLSPLHASLQRDRHRRPSPHPLPSASDTGIHPALTLGFHRPPHRKTIENP
jgi:hypothetical protein